MRYLAFFQCLFFSLFLPGQSYTFDGSILTSDREEIPYVLHIHIDSQYNIYGTSEKTWKTTKNRSTIEGKYTAENNTIYYIEHSLDNNGFEIEFQGFVSFIFRDIYALPGIYKSGSSLGHVNVICQNFKPNEKIKENINKKLVIDTTILSSSLEKNSNENRKYKTVKNNDVEKITVTQDYVNMKIFDQMIEDDDKITIVLNKKIIAKHLILTKKGYVYKLPLVKGKNVITIKAENEGKIDFNTSRMEVYNLSTKTFFTNILNKNESATYEIYY